MRELFTTVIGNCHQPLWQERLKDFTIDRLELDQWSAQKSRLTARTQSGEEVAVALKRPEQLHDGDLLRYDSENHRALVVCIRLNEVLVIDLSGLDHETESIRSQRLVELGHAIGNQHWPAVVRNNRVYVPLTVDRKVMQSVMESHRLEGLHCYFQAGREVIPYLAPHEVRRLFGGAGHENHTHTDHEQP